MALWLINENQCAWLNSQHVRRDQKRIAFAIRKLSNAIWWATRFAGEDLFVFLNGDLYRYVGKAK